MTSGIVEELAAAGGPGAPPRRNGELVFDAPWQSRAFGLAIALHDAGEIDYETFRSRLIVEIAGAEREHGIHDDGEGYYERWLDALQYVLEQQRILSPAEIASRAAAIADAWADDHVHSPGEGPA
jgi:nitrile hydratase accessory protein